jgi:hypothetical protein
MPGRRGCGALAGRLELWNHSGKRPTAADSFAPGLFGGILLTGNLRSLPQSVMPIPTVACCRAARRPLRLPVGGRSAVCFALWFALWLPTPAAAAEPPGTTPALRGLPLAQALQELQAHGLPVIFSSSLVPDSLRVEAEPAGVTPRALLDALLQPHGLAVQEAAGGRLVVIAAPPTGALSGRVLAGGLPLAGARVAVGGHPAVLTGADGTFVLPGLAPGSYRLAAEHPGFVSGRWEGIAVRAPRSTQVTLELAPVPVFADAIVVTPTGAGAEPADGLDVQTPGHAAALPHLGNDPLRAAALLPGGEADETSARVRTPGSRDDEVLILLDGLELLAPYHLQDFDSALSIVAPAAVARAELRPSGYPAEFGDRMGGVLDITTRPSLGAPRLTVGLSLLGAELAGAGALPSVLTDGLTGDRGRWQGSARAGSYHTPLEHNGRDADPRFWDAFAKVDLDLHPGHSLRVSALVAEDDLDLHTSPAAGAAFASRWENRYLWLTLDSLPRPDLLVETLASVGDIERRRGGHSATDEARFTVADRRTLGIAGLEQTWRYEPTGRFSLAGGLELRQLASDVDYANERRLAGPLSALRSRPVAGATGFRDHYEFDQEGAFLSGRLRPLDTVTAEVGVRFDRVSLPEESHTSPRFSLAWQPWPGGTLRLAWGWFYQSQRPNELQVEDDATALAPAERSEHRVAGVEHRWPGGTAVQLEAFERRQRRTQARFENLFNPTAAFPELADDRVRIDPAGGSLRGLEVTLRGTPAARLSWWLAGTASSAVENLDGRPGDETPRSFDQPHALRAGLQTTRLPGGLILGALWTWHSGRPTTAVSGRVVTAPDGSSSVEPVLGPLYGERLPAYHRLDLRASRSWTLARGRLTAWIDLQNAYDRENVRGFSDFSFARDPDGTVRVHSRPVSWGGLLPSFGIRWEL